MILGKKCIKLVYPRKEHHGHQKAGNTRKYSTNYKVWPKYRTFPSYSPSHAENPRYHRMYRNSYTYNDVTHLTDIALKYLKLSFSHLELPILGSRDGYLQLIIIEKMQISGNGLKYQE